MRWTTSGLFSLYPTTRTTVRRMSSQVSRKNIVVVGGSYAGACWCFVFEPLLNASIGAKAAELIAEKMHATHQTILVEKNTHFQHLFAFPRFAVVPKHEHKAFIPFTNMFNTTPGGVGTVVNARVMDVKPSKVLLDHGEPIPFEYLVMATGTKLTPPGTMLTTTKPEGISYFQKHQANVKDAIKIVVVGGGAVGIRKPFHFRDIELR